MAKILVKPALVFGASLTPTGNLAVYASLAQGAAAYSGDPAAIQSAQWLLGVAAGLINTGGGLASPALEDWNAIIYVLSYQIAYLKQAGIPEWDPTVVYYSKSWAIGSDGLPYISQQDANTNNDPTTSPAFWSPASKVLGTTAGSPLAWVVFDGRTGAIDKSFNVSSVNRTSAGCYTISFTTPMPNPFYGFSGSAGTRPGVGFINGDDNILTGGVGGKTPIRTAAQLGIFCFDRPNNATEDSSMISVMVFGGA